MKINHLVSIRLPLSIYRFIKENNLQFSKFCRYHLTDFVHCNKFKYHYDYTQKNRYSFQPKIRVNFLITDMLFEKCKNVDLEFTNFIINQLEYYMKEEASKLRIMAIKESKNLALEIEKMERDIEILKAIQYII